MDEMTVHSVMLSALQERGISVSPDQVAADHAALADGTAGAVQVQAVQTKPAPVGNDPASIDTQAFEGPASPSAYNFGHVPDGMEFDQQHDAAMRGLLHSEGVPVPIGNELARLYNAAMLSPPTTGQRAISEQRMLADLRRAWGSDMHANLKIARAEIDRMAKAQPGIREMLDVSGLGNSAWLAQSLVNMAKAKGRT